MQVIGYVFAVLAAFALVLVYPSYNNLVKRAEKKYNSKKKVYNVLVKQIKEVSVSAKKAQDRKLKSLEKTASALERRQMHLEKTLQKIKESQPTAPDPPSEKTDPQPEPETEPEDTSDIYREKKQELNRIENQVNKWLEIYQLKFNSLRKQCIRDMEEGLPKSQKFYNRYKSSPFGPSAGLHVAKQLYQADDTATAAIICREIINYFPNSKEIADATKMLKRISQKRAFKENMTFKLNPYKPLKMK